ncbi:MAG: hypothetical protein WBP93_23065 [Pyrinomonadaceae bacterium]
MPARFFSRFVILISLCLASAALTYASPNTEALARKAVSENSSESAQAIAELRALGPAGLRVLFEVHADEIKRHATGGDADFNSPQWQRLAAALDAVSQQRNDYLSMLYWYTDFERAKTAAKESGKPILSLRLLGNLNEELSCANSRFFRTALYSNAEISAALRERFILHWKSVRPAPRITIDYGDGRKFETTITGNSIHYILDAEGRVVDALPGLYGPQTFLRELTQAEAVAKKVAGQKAQQSWETLRAYHDARIDAIARDWAGDAEKVGVKVPAIEARNADDKHPPSARAAARMAVTKAISEIGTINAITYDARNLQQATNDEAWLKIASLHVEEARLDEMSRYLIRRQNQNLREINGQAAQAMTNDNLISNLIEKFQSNLALDTVRNEYMLHTQIHAWLIGNRYLNDLDGLNERVYAQLFMSPRSDPWLGLVVPDAYTGLQNGGVVLSGKE